jgi:uncharacterized Fe-S cluster-containing MiaB family protein
MKVLPEYLQLRERNKEKIGNSVMIKLISTDGKYYNTGDFCETCSYIIETLDGKIQLIYC